MLWFWWSHGSIQEGNALVRKALSLPTADQFQTYRARALNTAVYLHWVLGENDIDSLLAVSQKIEEALAILKNIGRRSQLGLVAAISWVSPDLRGKYELADVAMQEGTAIARKLGDLNKSSFSLAFHGDIALQQGDIARAERIYKESTDVLRSIGNILFTAYPLRRLGYLALMRNEISYVLENFKESGD